MTKMKNDPPPFWLSAFAPEKVPKPNYRRFELNFNPEKDKDIVDWLFQYRNSRSKYIKYLIREDMKKGGTY